MSPSGSPTRVDASVQDSALSDARVSDVSIITVNWNGREHLSHLLPSVIPLGAGEILLVDNGSSDGSLELVRDQFPSVRILQNPTNQGFAHPNNRAARAARGRYLAFINNDMRADERWLVEGLKGLNKGTPCVACRILDWEGKRVDYNGSSMQYLGYALQKDAGQVEQDVKAEEEVLFPCGGAMIIRRDLFLELGGFDKDYFAIFEDVDLGWRLWLTGHRIAFCPASKTFHRGHATFRSIAESRTRYLMHRNALITILKNYEEETFRKILPLAFLLAIKRAIHFSGVDKQSFYLWEETRDSLRWEDPRVQDRLLDALNHLVALDDVLQHLPEILAKRRRIQKERVRSDEQIIHRFHDPLRAIVQDASYLEEEKALLDLFDLSPLFQDYEFPPVPEGRSGHASELNAYQWLGSFLTQHPASSSGSKVRHLWRRWRRSLKRLVRSSGR